MPEKRRDTASTVSETAASPPMEKSQSRRAPTDKPRAEKRVIRFMQASSNSRIVSSNGRKNCGERKEGSRIPIRGITRPAESRTARRA